MPVCLYAREQLPQKEVNFPDLIWARLAQGKMPPTPSAYFQVKMNNAVVCRRVIQNRTTRCNTMQYHVIP